MVLAQALVAAENHIHASSTPGTSHSIPEIPLHRARQIMTRADFIRSYDHMNFFTITSKAFVRADSAPMQRAFRSICEEEGFDEHLQNTLDRISAIESLGRTREVVAKDLVMGGKYRVEVKEAERGGGMVGEVSLEEKVEGEKSRS